MSGGNSNRMTRRALLQHCEDRLAAAGVENAHAEARWLYEGVFSAPYTQENLLGKTALPVEGLAVDEMERLLQRRIAGEPLQYLLGEWEFYGRRFAVGKGVLIPRQDTETLIDCAAELYKNQDTSRLTAIDLCAGTGCIGIILEKELHFGTVSAVELYEEALGYLRENVRRHDSCVQIRQGDVLDAACAADFPAADLIVSNPPYLTAADMQALQKEVMHEPQTALYGNADGLHFYRGIARIWKNKLKPGGVLLFEVGATQARQVGGFLLAEGFEIIQTRQDLCGTERAVFGTKA